MDSLDITPVNNPSLTAADDFSGAGEPTTATSPIIRQPKRPVGRPKGSKNKGWTLPPRVMTRSRNSTAVVEIRADEPTTTNNPILRPSKRPVGRPKGSRNKRRTLPPPMGTLSQNSTAVDELTDNNRILQRVERRVGRPKGSKNKPKTVAPQPPIQMNSSAVIEIPAGASIVQSLLQFCSRHQVFLTVLNASGQLASFIPYTSPDHSMGPGPFQILSLSGTAWPTAQPLSDAVNAPELIYPLTALLASPDGALLGGMVGKSVKASSVVEVLAVMTAGFDHYVTTSEIVMIDDGVNNGIVEIAPVSQDLDFSDGYTPCTPMQSHDSQTNNHEEHHLMMNTSNNNELTFDDDDIWRYEEYLTSSLWAAEPYRFQ